MPSAAELLATLTSGHAELSDDERTAFDAALKESTPAPLKALRAHFFSAGKAEVTGGALKAARLENERLTTELADAAQARDAAKAAAEKGAPDLAARDAAWQKRLDAAEAKARDAAGEVTRVRSEADADKLETALLGAQLRPRYAKLVKRDLAERVTRKDDGTLEVRGPDGIPVPVPAGQTAWDVLAKMARAEAEPEDVLSNADSGAGVQGAAGAAGFGGYSANGNGRTPAKAEQERVEQARAAVSGAF